MIDIYIALFLILGGCAALWDFLFYKIPNTLVSGIIILFLIQYAEQIIIYDKQITFAPFLIFLGILLIGFLLFATNVIGAGDAKFLAATSLWMEQYNIAFFLIVMSISGGILALLALRYSVIIDTVRIKISPKVLFICEKYFKFSNNYIKNISSFDEQLAGKIIIPYGVPIFIGCLVLLF